MDKKTDIICDKRLSKYFAITEKALSIIKKNIVNFVEKYFEIVNIFNHFLLLD